MVVARAAVVVTSTAIKATWMRQDGSIGETARKTGQCQDGLPDKSEP